MGKSTSCLRIIACSGGSVDSNEASPVDQTKRSKEKKGWSFKKKSSTGRAVTNSVVAETPLIKHKEKNVQSAADEAIVSKKGSAVHWDEKTPPPPQGAADLCVPYAVKVSKTEKHPTPSAADSYVADDVSDPKIEKQSDPAQSDPAGLCVIDGLTDPKTGEYEAVLAVHESDVVLIQSAVRGFLSRKELKSIIKLQAVMRGHLVRCHAVGALRCVQAIAKMQVLLRTRYAHTRKDFTLPKSKPEITYTSMTDLLKTSFARQLLESSLKSKPIKIKCDPLNQDSSWVWLERWMSLASHGAIDDLNAGTETVQEVKNIGMEGEEKTTKKEQEKITVEDYLSNEENELLLDAKDFRNPSFSGEYSKLDVTEEAKLRNSTELTLTISDVDSHSKSSIERQKPDITIGVETVELAAEKDSTSHSVDAGEYSQHEEIEFVDNNSESKNEQAQKLENEVEAEEVLQLQMEIENFVLESRKEPDNLLVKEHELVSAPLSDSAPRDAEVEDPISATHVAAVYHDSVSLKDEVEEGPASVRNEAVEYISTPQDAETEEMVVCHSSEFDSNIEIGAAGDDIVINHKESSQPDHSRIQVDESDCITELSITSTLDSPDRSEIEPTKVELENAISADGESHESKTDIVQDGFETESGPVEKGKGISGTTSSESAEHATAKDKGMDEKELETNVSPQQLQSEAGEKTETRTNVSNLQAEPEGDGKSSHQASPGSQMTFSESQGTPSRQFSFKTKSKIAKSEKSGSIKKRTILSAAKKSPLYDSRGKTTSEPQSKENKSVKRRTSFGSPKPEISDQEHGKDSSTSSSLPGYMQATESAKAKANAAGHSPRSSPDVADNDVLLRKRHSLSGTKDKQDSPRLQRASSQSQSGSKSNGTSPLERKWQR